MPREGTKAAEIIQMRRAGFKYSEIAAYFDCTKGYISAVMQREKHGGSRPCDDRHTRRRYRLLKDAANA